MPLDQRQTATYGHFILGRNSLLLDQLHIHSLKLGNNKHTMVRVTTRYISLSYYYYKIELPDWLTVFHYAPYQCPKWLFTDSCLQNDRPSIIDLDSPVYTAQGSQ